jgi:hypothetical protein
MVMPTMQALSFLNHPGMIQGIKAPTPMPTGSPAPASANMTNIGNAGLGAQQHAPMANLNGQMTTTGQRMTPQSMGIASNGADNAFNAYLSQQTGGGSIGTQGVGQIYQKYQQLTNPTNGGLGSAPAPLANARPAQTPAAPMNISGGGSMGGMLNNMLNNGAMGGLMGIGR